MDAKGGRHVKARVGVVYLVEAPEERQLVVGAVPEVGDGVEPEDAHRDRYQRAGAQVGKQPESPLRGPDGDDPAAGAADDRDDEGVDSQRPRFVPQAGRSRSWGRQRSRASATIPAAARARPRASW